MCHLPLQPDQFLGLLLQLLCNHNRHGLLSAIASSNSTGGHRTEPGPGPTIHCSCCCWHALATPCSISTRAGSSCRSTCGCSSRPVATCGTSSSLLYLLTACR